MVTLNILIVSQYFWPENFRLNDLAFELSQRGHKVTVLTGYPNYPGGKIYQSFKSNPGHYENFNGIKIIRIPIIPRGMNKLILFLNYVSFVFFSSIFGVIKLRGLEFDRILVYQVSPITVGLPAILISWIKKAPIYFWVLDQWPETLISMGIIKSKLTIYLFSVLSRYIYSKCHIILGQSESFLKNIKKYNVPSKKLHYFPNWAEEDFNNAENTTHASEIRKDKDDFVILFAGNIGEAQKLDYLLEAVSLTEQNGKIKWFIIGKGRDWNRINSIIKQKKLESIKLLGQFPLSRMPQFYAAADALFVCLKPDPLFSITIPGKLQTYMLSGKPIIGMLDGEGANLINKAKAGLTCKAGDFKKFGQKSNFNGKYVYTGTLKIG